MSDISQRLDGRTFVLPVRVYDADRDEGGGACYAK